MRPLSVQRGHMKSALPSPQVFFTWGMVASLQGCLGAAVLSSLEPEREIWVRAWMGCW